MLGRYCFSCEDPDIILESFLFIYFFTVTSKHYVISRNNKQQDARKISRLEQACGTKQTAQN